MHISEKIKDIETFLNDDSVRTKIFGGAHPVLKRDFGNPHEFDEESLIDIQNVDFEQPEPAERPLNVKPYRPRKSTIVGLGEREKDINEAVKMHMSNISPFPYKKHVDGKLNDTIYTEKATGRNVLSFLMPFNSQELCGIDEETKYEISKNILKSIHAAVHQNKKAFLHKGFMFESDFETEKLKYLINEGEEPMVLPDTDFDFLEKLYLSAMEKLITTIFNEAYIKQKGKLNFKDKDGEEFCDFEEECARYFHSINEKLIFRLSSRYVTEALYNKKMDEKVISNYRAFTKCPITEELTYYQKEISSKWRNWEDHLNEMSSIEPAISMKLFSNENYVNLMHEILNYLKVLLDTEEELINASDKEFVKSLKLHLPLAYEINKRKINYYQRLYYLFLYLRTHNKQE